MKILSASQIRELDQYTIKNEPIRSIDLMERASEHFCEWFTHQFTDIKKTVHIFCGNGNNGGDGLAVARILHLKGYDVNLYLCNIGATRSEDNQVNLDRLPRFGNIPVFAINKGDDFPQISPDSIIIDAIFGSGLNRPVVEYWADLLGFLNQLNAIRVAIDIPSGLFADKHTRTATFQANYTLTFELPKLSFFFSENQESLGHWIIKSIGLHHDKIASAVTSYFYVDKNLISTLLKSRPKFGHKGTFGHALLIVGSYGKMGAAILSSTACLRSGVGLLSVHIPKCGYEIMQISVPEAMASIDPHQYYLSEIPKLKNYKAIGIGCGLDKKKTSRSALKELLNKATQPLVLDADALNMLSQQPDWSDLLPPNSILTPHPKEFERLFGKTEHHFERIQLQIAEAQKRGIIIVLKGAHTSIATPEGECFFNSTGNPGMGTGGSGDVLTGIITGLLAQGYTATKAAILGVYIHGLAGDLAAADLEHESLIARDINDYLGKAFVQIHQDISKL
ncbi:MAG: NAD(P)H-hydrate dehydratase [Chitinophagales bacterium]|nr:NAD(P)H-hydrate dehydratase [Chitinophagales bacterium]